MSHDGDRDSLYRHFFLEQLSSLKIHERVIDKETDICFCQNVRFLFGICSLESHFRRRIYSTPISSTNKNAFSPGMECHAGSFGVTSAMILI